jgi:protein-disulfide isomerase
MLLMFTSLGVCQAVPGRCPGSSSDVKERIEAYLAHRLVSGTGAKAAIKSIELLSDSCYRKLTMTIPGTDGDVVMYLTPDERFLTSTLYDTLSDPEKEVARIADDVNKLLMRDESPSVSGSSSHVTLVEFGDLQCPYSKMFGEWYSALPRAIRDETTLVFKHLPLKQHSWARTAALYSACAGKQSSTAFWSLSGFFLTHQSELNVDNIKATVLAEIDKMNDLDSQQVLACASQEGGGIVDRDVDLAQRLAVRNTPTLVINGLRVVTHDRKRNSRGFWSMKHRKERPCSAALIEFARIVRKEEYEF